MDGNNSFEPTLQFFNSPYFYPFLIIVIIVGLYFYFLTRKTLGFRVFLNTMFSWLVPAFLFIVVLSPIPLIGFIGLVWFLAFPINKALGLNKKIKEIKK
jgi:hypothetical protein